MDVESCKRTCWHRSNYKYTPLVAKLIETCYETKIFKLKDLVRLLGISVSYAHYLLKKLKRDLSFKIWALPSYEKLALRVLRCFLQVKSMAYRRLLLETLSQHAFVTYIARCHGSSGKGIWCDFLVPDGKGYDFSFFLESLQNHGIIDAYEIRPVITLRTIVMGFEWYDFSTNLWRFDWQAFLKDMLSKVDSLDSSPFYEFKPSTSNVKFDFYDLFMLHYLEQDALTPLASLALRLRTSPQNFS